MTNEELLERINNMTHEELARVWRFAPLGDPITNGLPGRRVNERLWREFGGITPELSKKIGWER